MKTSCIQGQLLPSARAEAERRVEAATEITSAVPDPVSSWALALPLLFQEVSAPRESRVQI